MLEKTGQALSVKEELAESDGEEEEEEEEKDGEPLLKMRCRVRHASRAMLIGAWLDGAPLVGGA